MPTISGSAAARRWRHLPVWCSVRRRFQVSIDATFFSFARFPRDALSPTELVGAVSGASGWHSRTRADHDHAGATKRTRAATAAIVFGGNRGLFLKGPTAYQQRGFPSVDLPFHPL